MPKNRRIKVLVPENTLQRTATIENEQVRFELQRKEKEIREISRILQGLLMKSRDERRVWLQENEDLMINLAEEFVDESLYKLDGAQLDNETLELSVQVMTELRKTLGLFETVITGNEELEA
ncbi:MAG TPA: hypothetical protein DIV47_04695 [Candidatus Pacebacteria bacterium]|nr:hypothetical protein [Candidatus Paceibacterota bacterium]